ncbi:unnamed protein product [Trifolium pratense]|uniref:Uncharacterized protein n=1 Tax=Trifolium pratense TaxID=57577 RepID=A0ACB0LLU7_TRIPR|nr:unnamed protein product [Trifolium pratense]
MLPVFLPDELITEVLSLLPFHCGFGYDNSTGTYKIVSLCQMRKEVRVLRIGDNVWRSILCFPDAQVSISLTGVYVNGSLNWLTIPKQSDYGYSAKTLTINQFGIISLDLSKETYLQLLPPRGFDKVPVVRPNLFVLMDSLCFSHDFNETDLIIWQMKQFGVQESWIQLLKISYHTLRIVYNVRLQSILFPLYLSENGDTLILMSNEGDHQAILYNLRDNTVEKTRITNKVTLFLSKDYVESLVSTCLK